MNRISLHKNRTYQAVSAIMSLAVLTGCAEFHEKCDTQKVAWSRQQGDKTLTVQGYTLNEGEHSPCFEKGFRAALIPDDDYAKKYVKFLIKTDRDPLFRRVSPEGRALIRYANWQHKCVYQFKNLPAGKWVVVFDIQNSIIPVVTVATDMGPATSTAMVSGDTYVWAPVEIKADDTNVKKKLIFNQAIPQHDSTLNFQWGDNVSVHQGQLLSWGSVPEVTE